MQPTGSRTAHLDHANNDLATLAASFNGPLSYTDKNALSVGTVADAFSGMTTSGITSTSHDVKLTTVLGDLTIDRAIAAGTGNLTLNVSGALSQTTSGLITAAGLQLTGSGTAHLDNANNDVTTLAASFNGPLSSSPTHPPSDRTVADAFSGMTTSGITSTNHDVKLTTVL